MPSFPFFRLPFPNFYSPYYNNYIKKTHYYNLEKSNNNYIEQKKEHCKKSNNYKKTSSKYNSSNFDFITNLLNGNIDDPIFEILGIELYLDDIIILGLLFILYKEGVQDEMLFLALILLLLT